MYTKIISGLGMLRGMGFKEGQGIGGFKQQVVPCIEPAVRPKGLGLGAARPGQTQKGGSTNKDSKTDEELILKRGSFVFIETGSHKNLYGQVNFRCSELYENDFQNSQNDHFPIFLGFP